MINIEFHKGSPCVYKAILCQEGWCSECAIYQRRSTNLNTIRDQEILRSPQQNNTQQLCLARR
jgi:hypothetical protein